MSCVCHQPEHGPGELEGAVLLEPQGTAYSVGWGMVGAFGPGVAMCGDGTWGWAGKGSTALILPFLLSVALLCCRLLWSGSLGLLSS